jgi:hypothetical protein
MEVAKSLMMAEQQDEPDTTSTTKLVKFTPAVFMVLNGKLRTYLGHYFHYEDDDRSLPAFPITRTSYHPNMVATASTTPHNV